MRRTTMLFSVFTLAAVIAANVPALADVGVFGIGLKAGVNQLDGDWHNPKLNPHGLVRLSYRPIPYLSFGGVFGYSELRTKDPKIGGTEPSIENPSLYKTIIAPLEADITFNLFPLAKLNPFVTIGGGTVWWDAIYDGDTVQQIDTKKEQQGFDSFLKAGGGLELRVKQSLGISLSATFRYSLTDMLDQVYSGDEKDAIISACVGLTYYFRLRTKGDMDSDGIPDILDLDPKRAEDKNGYLDHDGKPDSTPPLSEFFGSSKGKVKRQGDISPVVIHHPITEAEEKQPIKIVADIYEHHELRVTTVLYRIVGTKDWKVLRLKKKESKRYETTIPGQYVTPAGLEYCVLAVDQAVTGVGRAGWPKQPIRVNVNKNASTWRIIGGTVAALSWGLATFIMLRKQNTD